MTRHRGPGSNGNGKGSGQDERKQSASRRVGPSGSAAEWIPGYEGPTNQGPVKSRLPAR